MTALAPEAAETDTDDDGLTHLVCCNEDIALCGTDVSGTVFVCVDVAIDCVVCLLTTICRLCGRPIDTHSEGDTL